MINKIKLNIISNRKLCENENLERQIEKIFLAYEKKIILKNFEIVSLTLREKDLNKNEYLKLIEKVYPICQKYKINLILHQNYDLNLGFSLVDIVIFAKGKNNLYAHII